MSLPGKARRSFSASPEHDADADYQLALQLSEELNGEHPAPSYACPAQQPDCDDDADYALALELQFGDSSRVHMEEQGASSSGSKRGREGKTPQAEVLPSWALQENEPKVAHYSPETPGGKVFKTLAEFVHYLKSSRCSSCGQAFFRSELDVSTMLQNWRNANTVLTSSMKCRNCSVSSCVFCTPQAFANWSVISVQGKEVTWCCVGGRLLLLWLLLCGVDEHFSAAKLKEATHSKPGQQAQPVKESKMKSKPSERGGGVGFGGSKRWEAPAAAYMPSGMGYGSDMEGYEYDWGAGNTLSGHRFDPKSGTTDSRVKALSEQSTEDRFYGLHLGLIEGLLPSFERESSFDFDPPEPLAEMLIESKILNYCTELLRNDSLEDATKRESLYQALISLLRTLGAHYITASGAIYNERPSREDKLNLLVISFRGSPGASLESSSSLLNSLSNLNTQSELVLHGAKREEKEFQTQEGQNLLLLCRQIVDLQQYLLANSGTYGKVNPATCKAEVPALSDLPDEEVFASHTYATSAKALRSPPAGRFKRLITEITTLKTGLPPGIFVRYAESRPDVLKIAIIGPAGTPYENGIFEFDFYCDENFPNKPPLVQFKTTRGGSVSFNPNLYPDGKVCLSLLGTWQGEPWVPAESTLLQVVISIQAMILCEEPWYNEPGREAAYRKSSSGQGPAASYNQNIRQHTVRTAMLEWLDKPSPLWNDVIKEHFTANADEILHTAVKWSESKVQPASAGLSGFDDDFDNNNLVLNGPSINATRSPVGYLGDVASILPRLQTALNKYGASQIVPRDFKPVTQEQLYAQPKRAVSKSQVAPSIVLPPPPYPPPPPMPTYTYPYFQAGINPSHQGHGFAGLEGPGRTLGSNESEHSGTNPSNTASGGRGGFDAYGRYETMSSTRGRGGSGITPTQGGPAGSGSSHLQYLIPPGYGAGPPGRGGFSQDVGRGGHGAWGGRGGRGGRGGF